MRLFQEQAHNTEVDREIKEKEEIAKNNTHKYEVIQCNMQIKIKLRTICELTLQKLLKLRTAN